MKNRLIDVHTACIKKETTNSESNFFNWSLMVRFILELSRRTYSVPKTSWMPFSVKTSVKLAKHDKLSKNIKIILDCICCIAKIPHSKSAVFVTSHCRGPQKTGRLYFQLAHLDLVWFKWIQKYEFIIRWKWNVQWKSSYNLSLLRT